MLSLRLEKTIDPNESNMSNRAESSKFFKLSGKCFSFPIRIQKNSHMKHNDCEFIQRNDNKHSGILKTIKQRFQIKMLIPSKSKQKMKEVESVRRDNSKLSLSFERLDEIQEQVKTSDLKGTSNSVNSYIAALMVNSKNDKQVPTYNELVDLKSFNCIKSDHERGGRTVQSSNDRKINPPRVYSNSENSNNDLIKRESQNNTEYQCDRLGTDYEFREISSINGDSNGNYPGGRSTKVVTLSEELLKLSKYGWYWGPISGEEADLKLSSEPDGAFLVRDSSDDRYLLTLSFKSSGKLLHARMEHSGGLFSLCNHSENHGYTSVVDLINHSMSYSESSVFCYSRPRQPGYPSFPVRLTKPISRFTQIRSLQYLCRFVIRQNTRLDNIHKLPLPKSIRSYIEEAHY